MGNNKDTNVLFYKWHTCYWILLGEAQPRPQRVGGRPGKEGVHDNHEVACDYVSSFVYELRYLHNMSITLCVTCYIIICKCYAIECILSRRSAWPQLS